MHAQYTHCIVTFKHLYSLNQAATRHYKHYQCNLIYFSWALKSLVWAAWGWLCNTEICQTVNKTLRLFVLCVQLVGLIKEKQVIFLAVWRKIGNYRHFLKHYILLNTKWPGAKFAYEIQGQVVYALRPAINGRRMAVALTAVLKHR